MNIVLLGYMGCGKTTIGKIVSKVTGKRFIDLDSYKIGRASCRERV